LKLLVNILFAIVLFLSCQSSTSENERIDACLSRESISTIVIKRKLNQVKPLENPSWIEGEWEEIAALMTWQDEKNLDNYFSTFIYGEHDKNHPIRYTFLPNNRAEFNLDSIHHEMSWGLTDSNRRLEIKYANGRVDESFIRMNRDTIELIYSGGDEQTIYSYKVLKRIK
jgi:hypothetical protein